MAVVSGGGGWDGGWSTAAGGNIGGSGGGSSKNLRTHIKMDESSAHIGGTTTGQLGRVSRGRGGRPSPAAFAEVPVKYTQNLETSVHFVYEKQAPATGHATGHVTHPRRVVQQLQHSTHSKARILARWYWLSLYRTHTHTHTPHPIPHTSHPTPHTPYPTPHTCVCVCVCVVK